MPAPIHPRCGTEGLNAPEVNKVENFSEGGGHAWALRYTQKAGAPPGQMTGLVLVETPPSAPAPKPREPGARSLTVAGRGAVVRRASPRLLTAQWKTSRAFYSAIVTGGREPAVRRLIACVP